MIKLVRVEYGKIDTPSELGEYRLNGSGPVGTLKEWSEYLKGEQFIVIDAIDFKRKMNLLRQCDNSSMERFD